MARTDIYLQIAELKRHLQEPRKPGHAKPRLQDIDRVVPEAAWLVLRWCVASCTAHLEELYSEDEKVKNMGTCQTYALLQKHSSAEAGEGRWARRRAVLTFYTQTQRGDSSASA